MEMPYIRTMSNFPILVKTAANFPNSLGPGPIPKKGCESPVGLQCLLKHSYMSHF